MPQTGLKLLPENFKLSELGLSFHSFTKDDWPLYYQIYSDRKLMQFITDDLSKGKIRENFNSLLNVQSTDEAKYRSYRIISNGAELGVLGLKWIDHKELQFGVILLGGYQKNGWSKRIKLALIAYAYNQLNVSKMVAYCAEENGAANHVNKSIGMSLSKINRKRTEQLINKWEI